MKTIINIVLLSCAMGFLLTAAAQDHREIFEDKAKVGPLNSVLRPVTIKDTDTKPRQTNPYFLDFHITDSSNRTALNDSLFPVQVLFDKPGEIRVTNQERPMLIQYALPESLSFQQGFSLQEALVILKTTNNPSGAHKRLEIHTKNLLNTAFFWEAQAAAFSYKTPDGLLIQQEPQEEKYDQQEGYQSIPISITADGQKQSLELGKPLRFSHQGKDYTAYALESSYLQSEDDGGCASGGYIIRMIISTSIAIK